MTIVSTQSLFGVAMHGHPALRASFLDLPPSKRVTGFRCPKYPVSQELLVFFLHFKFQGKSTWKIDYRRCSMSQRGHVRKPPLNQKRPRIWSEMQREQKTKSFAKTKALICSDRVSIGLCSDGTIWIKTGSIFDGDLTSKNGGIMERTCRYTV